MLIAGEIFPDTLTARRRGKGWWIIKISIQ